MLTNFESFSLFDILVVINRTIGKKLTVHNHSKASVICCF